MKERRKERKKERKKERGKEGKEKRKEGREKKEEKEEKRRKRRSDEEQGGGIKNYNLTWPTDGNCKQKKTYKDRKILSHPFFIHLVCWCL